MYACSKLLSWLVFVPTIPMEGLMMGALLMLQSLLCPPGGAVPLWLGWAGGLGGESEAALSLLPEKLGKRPESRLRRTLGGSAQVQLSAACIGEKQELSLQLLPSLTCSSGSGAQM